MAEPWAFAGAPSWVDLGIVSVMTNRTALLNWLSLWLVAALSGCGDAADDRREVAVFAAASLVDVFADLEAGFEARHPSTDLVISYAGSQILAAQLLEGAPGDVFASADANQMERVADLMDESIVFAANRLVVIAAPSSPVSDIDGLSRDGVPIVIAGESVPAGRYSMVALADLGMLESVSKNVVSYEHDVRGVLAKVAFGEADAGIVYATDAASLEPGAVRVIDFAPGTTPNVYYLAGVRKDAREGEAARAFLGYLSSADARAILARHGFEAP